ncbi:AbrB family transcriptional regulator [Thalassovita sp.]|uniref:AbrB family transcriptional regulator n=1 Tax=Thalassovita sp. TaxID=1979401 RepID=UPI003B5AEDA7
MTSHMTTALTTLILLAIASVGGFVASYLHTPLPYMLGSLIASGVIAMFLTHRIPDNYKFPMKFRMIFMSIIGVTIGTRVTPEVVSSLADYLPSFAFLTIFVCVAHWVNYHIFRKIGRYDHPTAFYAGTPGGLIESIAMGEAAGANIAVLTIQQFLRIIAVITLMPIGMSLWYGAPVGSASGLSLAETGADLHAMPMVLLLGAIGLGIGKLLRIPAGLLTGPLLVAAIATLSGFTDLSIPQWVINMCQVVIGTSLGMRFAGLKKDALFRASWLSVLSVSSMLVLGLICALILVPITGLPVDVLLISFAPGGVTEMALIALSLRANPAIVTLHHIYRIILTVVEMTAVVRFMDRKRL